MRIESNFKHLFQLVEDLKTQQQSLEAEIAKIQQKKEAERALLINQLNNG